MRAIQITEFGGPEVLRLVDLPRPEPAAGEVLIRVTRAGLNFADTHTRENAYIAKHDLPLIPGTEVAGVREDSGERVVARLPGRGGYAEYAVAAESAVVPVPEGLADGVDLVEEGRREGEVGGGAAEHPIATAERGLDGVEGDGSDDGEGHGGARR